MNVHVYERLFRWFYATEGPVPYMYLDKLGLVTVGIGFMIEGKDGKIIRSWRTAFLDKDGHPADPDEVEKEFTHIKTDMQALRGKHLNFKPTAKFFLPAAGMKPTVLSILKMKESALKHEGWMKDFYNDFDTFPPDAQMGCLSTAYGGMYNKSPAQQAFNQACKDQRWDDAADSGYWDGWNADKIAGHKLMFHNAQVVKDTKDMNPQPAFPGTLSTDGYEIDDRIRPYGKDLWTAGN